MHKKSAFVHKNKVTDQTKFTHAYDYIIKIKK